MDLRKLRLKKDTQKNFAKTSTGINLGMLSSTVSCIPRKELNIAHNQPRLPACFTFKFEWPFLHTHFMLQFQTLLMIHISIVIVQVSLKCSATSFLCITCLFRQCIIISVTRIPRTAVRFPRTKTHPTKFHFTSHILACHVVAPTVLFYCHLQKRENSCFQRLSSLFRLQ